MASGQKVAEENYAAFIAWSSNKTDDDWREYVHRGKLKRSEIAAECGFGKSALAQNPAVRSALEALERDLRSRNVLPPLVEVSTSGSQEQTQPPLRDSGSSQRRVDGQRLNRLEQENAALRAELREAKAALEKYGLFARFLDENGRMPR